MKSVTYAMYPIWLLFNTIVFLIICAVATASCASVKIYVCADVEGNWQKVSTFVEKTSGALIIQNDNPDNFDMILASGVKIVFLGDAIDKWFNDIKILKFLIYLKEKYPDQVVLLMGNRDINKLRLLWELRLSALVLQGENRFDLDKFRLTGLEDTFISWIDKGYNTIDGVVVPYSHGCNEACDRILKLKWILHITMGAPGAFEHFKKEMGIDSDQQACDAYLRIMLCPENGLIIKYLRLAEMIHFDQETRSLFVHGGISYDALGYVPETSLGRGDFQKIDLFRYSITDWVATLNRWARDRVEDALAGNMLGALSIIQYQEPKIIIVNGKHVWSWMANPISVIRGRPWGDDDDLAPITAGVAYILREYSGVAVLVYGHTPIGDVPVIVKEHGMITIVCDTTGVKPGRNAAVMVTVDKAVVYADYYDTETKKKYELTYGTADPVIGTSWMIDDCNYRAIAFLEDNRLLMGHWVLGVRGRWSEERYKITDTLQMVDKPIGAATECTSVMA